MLGLPVLHTLAALSPVVLMLLAALLASSGSSPDRRRWKTLDLLSLAALAAALLAGVLHGVAAAMSVPLGDPALDAWLVTTRLGATLAVLVQLLGTVIARFSARYLEGEAGQARYGASLAGVLAAVHLLLLANHWLVLIAAWALVGRALQPLLCFYAERPFALLAAFKKRLADRLADALLAAAAALAWSAVGSGSFTDLWAHLAREGASPALQASAVCLVLAVVLRTALLPVHGWLVQVMEAPTPVSALLHAGVVNLGGFVLIRFAPLLEQAMPARWLLVVAGLATALLAGLVMLTRVSIKVRLAWSTVAQMGFMVLECGLGLYTLAALHLIGHSLYKAHSFLSASSAVRHTRLQDLSGTASPGTFSLLLAPALSVPAVWLVAAALGGAAWPWWWSVVLGLAWAPLLWTPARAADTRASRLLPLWAGLCLVGGFTALARVAHGLPWGLVDAPDLRLGLLALAGLAVLYASQVALQLRPQAVAGWRRWSYAGFYVDELYTRLALRLWPARWTPEPSPSPRPTWQPAASR